MRRSMSLDGMALYKCIIIIFVAVLFLFLSVLLLLLLLLTHQWCQFVIVVCVCSRLNSSSLLCDCQLPTLTQWLRQTGFHATVDARCRYPESLAGISILDVQPQDLSCGTQYLIKNHHHNTRDNVYGAVVMSKSLQKFTWFMWWM